MFFIACVPRPGERPFGGVIMRRERRDLKKVYACARKFYPSNVSAAAAALAGFHDDRRYSLRAPHFSQDGRPKRTMRHRPVIVVDARGGGKRIAAMLRGAGVPVEAVFPGEGDACRRQVSPGGWGGDILLPADAASVVLRRVRAQARLEGHPEEGGVEPALALAVWFAENRLRLRRRSAGQESGCCRGR